MGWIWPLERQCGKIDTVMSRVALRKTLTPPKSIIVFSPQCLVGSFRSPSSLITTQDHAPCTALTLVRYRRNCRWRFCFNTQLWR